MTAGWRPVVLSLVLAMAGCTTTGDDRLAPGTDGVSADAARWQQVETELAAHLLHAEAVAKLRAEPGQWHEATGDEPPLDPMPSGCDPDAVAPGGASAATVLRGPQDIVLAQESRAYENAREAEAAFARLVDDVACAGQLVDGLPGSGPTRVYSTSTGGGSAVAYAVEQVGRYLVAVALRSREPREHVAELPPLVDVAAGRIRLTIVEPQQPAPAPAAPDDGLLRAQDLAEAGLGVWTVETLSDPEGGLFECMRAAGPGLGHGYPEVGGGSRATRAADGALVQQSTQRHEDEDVAAAQLDAHVAAVRACPSEEILDWPAEPRVVLSVATHEIVEQTRDRLVVRTAYACDTCDGDTTYLGVLRVGPWLTVLNLPAERGSADPAALARELMDAAAARLAAVG